MTDKILHSILITAFVGSLVAVLAFSTPQKITPVALKITQTAAVADFASNLISHYTFDETSGTTAADSKGSNTGTLSNGPTWSLDKMVGSGALQFDGVDDGVSLGSGSEFQGRTAFSVGGWFKMSNNSTGIQTFFSKFNGNWNNGPFILWYVGISEKIILTVHTSPTTYANASFNYPPALANGGEWHHVMGTYDGTTIKVYVDGVLGQTATLPGVSMTDTTPAWIGRSAGANDFFKGNLDDFRFYNKALSASEIADLVALGGGASPSNTTPDDPDDEPPTTNQPQTPTADTTAPTITNTTSGSYAAGTTQVNLTVSTNEAATCKYDVSSSKTYDTMSNTLSASNDTSHSSIITGLTNGTTSTYYVKCKDTAGNTSTNTTVSFAVRNPTTLPANAQIIDSDATIPLPTSALWNSIINFRPGHGETVAINPPGFSWLYDKNPLEVGDLACQNGFPSIGCAPKEFVFQVARSESDLKNQSNLVVNVRTPINAYNALKPFDSGTYYWWVGYIKPKDMSKASAWTMTTESFESAPYAWSSIRRFTVTSGATKWDRSGFANEAYLAEKAVHPYILITPQTRTALWTWLENMEKNYLNAGSAHERKIANTWNHNKKLAQNYSPLTINDLNSALAAYQKIRAAGLVWQLTMNAEPTSAAGILHAQIEAKKPWEDLVEMANWFISSGAWAKDTDIYFSDAAFTRSFGYSYDWWYEKMTDQQRKDVRRAIDAYVSHRMGTLDGFNFSPLKEVPTSFWTPAFSQYKTSTSHQWIDTEVGIIPALATFRESTSARKFFDFVTNYFPVHPIFFAGGTADGALNMGRGYNGGELRKYKILQDIIAYQIAFSDKISRTDHKFNLVPFWKNNANWWMATTPNLFTQYRDPWGDGGAGKDSHGASITWGRDLAYFLNNGSLLQYHFNEQQSMYGGSPYAEVRNCMGSCVEDFEEPILAYYAENNMFGLQKPSISNSAERTSLFINDGWATGCSGNILTPECFSGVGFIFRAAPGNGLGSTRGHNNPADLSYQLWAYGAPITDTGDIGLWSYSKFSEGQYSVLVDGKGQWQTPWAPNEPFYSRFFAHDVGSNYVYYAADATNAYARKVNNAAGLHGGNDYVNAPHAHLEKAHRHFLFVRNKYFVTFDDFQTSKPATFSWVYHVPWLYHKTGDTPSGWITTSKEDKFRAGAVPTEFSYVAGNVPVSDYSRALSEVNVPVKVKIMNDPATVTVEDLSGSSVRKNPITGKDYMSGGDQYPRPHAIWASNKTKATNFNFLTVIYPQKPGAVEPKIERIDDHTTRVTSEDGTVDVISFNPETAAANEATIVVDLSDLEPPSVLDDVMGVTSTSVKYVPPAISTPTFNTPTTSTATPGATQTPAGTPGTTVDIAGGGGAVTSAPTTATGVNLSTAPDFTLNMSRGSTQKEVLILQALLLQEGFLIGSYTDGVFDRATEEAVRSFQRKNNISSFGTVNAATRLKLNELLKKRRSTVVSPVSTPTLIKLLTAPRTFGSTHEEIKKLQIFLNTNGFTIAASGPGSKGLETAYFGPATLKALNRFQISKSLTSRTLDITTVNLINTLATATSTPVTTLPTTTGTFTRTLSLGMSGEDVKALQIFLNNKGFTIATSGPGSKGNETTFFGAGTKAALIRFQETYRSEILTPNGLTRGTGTFGPSTIKKINSMR